LTQHQRRFFIDFLEQLTTLSCRAGIQAFSIAAPKALAHAAMHGVAPTVHLLALAVLTTEATAVSTFAAAPVRCSTTSFVKVTAFRVLAVEISAMLVFASAALRSKPLTRWLSEVASSQPPFFSE